MPSRCRRPPRSSKRGRQEGSPPAGRLQQEARGEGGEPDSEEMSSYDMAPFHTPHTVTVTHVRELWLCVAALNRKEVRNSYR